MLRKVVMGQDENITEGLKEKSSRYEVQVAPVRES